MEERRQGMDELKLQVFNLAKTTDLMAIEIRQVRTDLGHQQSYLESEFGGRGISGQPTEGNQTRQLRELNDRQKMQNGRVGKLEDKIRKIEDWRLYILGGAGALGMLCSFVTLIVTVCKK